MNDTVRAILGGLSSRLRSPWVFPSDTGRTPLDAENFINRVFRPALESARIENFRWHDLRHTFASRLAMAGVDLNTIRELLGHKTLAMTLRYAHLSPAHQLDAVQRLNRPEPAQPGAPPGDPSAIEERAGQGRAPQPGDPTRLLECARPDSNGGPAGSKPDALSS